MLIFYVSPLLEVVSRPDRPHNRCSGLLTLYIEYLQSQTTQQVETLLNVSYQS